MYCSKCGTKVADDDYACYMCGSRLRNNVRSALEILREQDALEAAGRARELENAWKQTDENAGGRETVFSDDPIEATVAEMFERSRTGAGDGRSGFMPADSSDGLSYAYEPEDNEDLEYIHTLIGERDVPDRRRASKGPVIAAIVIASAAVLITGVYLMLTRSQKEVGETEETVQVRDMDKETGIQDETAAEEPEEEVRVSMIGRVRELRDDYINEEISYDEVMTEFDLLKDSVFDDIDEYNEINDQLDRINTSRKAYEKAEKAYERGSYPEAVEEYKKVIEEDERYYGKAEEGIKKCDEAVLDLVRGRWKYEYDARKEVQQYVKEKGFDIDLSAMKIPIIFIFDLKDDGSIDVSVDYDALNAYIDKVLDLVVETMSKGVEANIPGNVDISSLLKNVYSSTGMKDNIKEQLNIQEALDNLLKESGVDKIDSYRAKDGHLYIGTACMDVSCEEDTLILVSDDSEALAVGHYKMPYPIKMNREKKEQ